MRRKSKAANRSVEVKADCVTERDKPCPNRAVKSARTNLHKNVKTTSIMGVVTKYFQRGLKKVGSAEKQTRVTEKMEPFLQCESSTTSCGDSKSTIPSCSSVTTYPHSESSSSSQGLWQQSAPPECKRARKFGDCKRVFHKKWELDYLVTYDSKSDTCTCLKCKKTLDTVKKYILQRHNTKVHPDTVNWSREKLKLFVEQQKLKVRKMQSCLGRVGVLSRLPKLAHLR